MKNGGDTLCIRVVLSCLHLCARISPEAENYFEAFLEQQKPLGEVPLDPTDPTAAIFQSHRASLWNLLRVFFLFLLHFCFPEWNT